MNGKHDCANLRPSDTLVPAAFLIASIAGHGSPAMFLCLNCLAVHGLSLFSSHGTRIAFARQPAIRQVRGSVKSALLLQVTALAILLSANTLHVCDGMLIPTMAVAGFFLNAEHTFYEYLIALGDGWSASMCHFLTALFLAAGLSLAGSQLHSPWLPATAGLSAAVALTISLVTGSGRKGRLNGGVLRCAPRAMLQSCAYPVAAAACAALLRPKPSPAACFSGLVIYSLCRTPYRRSASEAAPLNRTLLFTVAVGAACATLYTWIVGCGPRNPVSDVCGAVTLASACAFCVYSRPSGRVGPKARRGN